MIKKYEKYKESGIEWLGEIPGNWDLKKLKFLANIRFSSVDRHEYDEEFKVSICHYPDAYKNEKINCNSALSFGTCSDKELQNYALKKGQVIITKDSETADDIGIPTFVEEDIPNAVCGYHLAILESTNENFNTAFLFRYLQSDKVSTYFETNSNGVTRFGLGKPTIENLIITFPTLSEQTQIANFLDHQTAIIDDLIGQKEKLISLLKEKRQAIINEAVTKGLNPNAPMKDSGIEWLGEVPEGWKVLKLKHVKS
jgi:type I restriction enzyme, S subunit